MKKLVFLLLAALPLIGKAQGLYFPSHTGNNWDTVSLGSLGWCSNYIDTLNDYLQQEDSRAFILLKDGRIVHEQYFNGYHIDSAHTWNSAGKTMITFLIGLAQQENKLSITDKTSDYLGTAWTSAPIAKEHWITIQHQLSMNTGLDDGVSNPFCTDASCLQYIGDAGTRWAYHNGPYTLLQDVLQSATSTHPTLYVNQKLNGIAGITGAFVKIGYNKIFFSNARSMARFGLLMLNKGNWDGHQILTDTAYFNQSTRPSQSLNPAYGYLWWLNGQSNYMLPGSQTTYSGKLFPNVPDDAYAALGKDNQLIVIVPSQQLVFIRMGRSGSSHLVGPQMVDKIWQIIDKLMCTPNSLNQVNRQEDVLLYPNPSSELIRIRSAHPIKSVEVYTTLGRSMSSVDIDKINISSYPAGVYFLRLKTKAGTSTHKFIKQ